MKSNIHIVIGHYGSGKTEFAVNYAIRRRESGSEVALADLDIVNPYFRTRQQADMLEAKMCIRDSGRTTSRLMPITGRR